MAQNDGNKASEFDASLVELVEVARRAKMERMGEPTTFEFDVTLDELVDSGGMDGLNDILESRLSDKGFSYIPSGIDYRAIGLVAGDDTHEGIITILATYVPDYMDADEDDIDEEDRIVH